MLGHHHSSAFGCAAEDGARENWKVAVCFTVFDLICLLKLPYPISVGDFGELPRLARSEEQPDELVLLAHVAFFIRESDLPFMERIAEINLLCLGLKLILILFVHQLRPAQLPSQDHLLRQRVRRRDVVVPLVLQILQLVHIFLDLFIHLLLNQPRNVAVIILHCLFVVIFLKC